jgi:catechol 2,3-dioxygenase-like lactoylglutathione lyase family enzyme
MVARRSRLALGRARLLARDDRGWHDALALLCPWRPPRAAPGRLVRPWRFRMRDMTETRGFKVRALGEIAIRCDDLGPMVAFYEDIIGLDRMSGNASSGIVFFRIAEGFGRPHHRSRPFRQGPQSAYRPAPHKPRRTRNRRALLPPPHRADHPLRGTGRRDALVRSHKTSNTASSISAGSAGAASSPRTPKATPSNSSLTTRALKRPDPLHLSKNTVGEREGAKPSRPGRAKGVDTDRRRRRRNPLAQTAALRISSR